MQLIELWVRTVEPARALEVGTDDDTRDSLGLEIRQPRDLGVAESVESELGFERDG